MKKINDSWDLMVPEGSVESFRSPRGVRDRTEKALWKGH